jgi:transcriptional regulator with XRE-family HTH domain
MLNTNSSLVNELREKQYRDAYVASQIRVSLPFQIRALRENRPMTQPELGKLAGMTQPRISEIERPGERRLNVDTLLRLASALDVALQIRFVPFSELIDWADDLDIDSYRVPSFGEELRESGELHKNPASVRNLNELLLQASGQLVSGEQFEVAYDRFFEAMPQGQHPDVLGAPASGKESEPPPKICATEQPDIPPIFAHGSEVQEEQKQALIC